MKSVRSFALCAFIFFSFSSMAAQGLPVLASDVEYTIELEFGDRLDNEVLPARGILVQTTGSVDVISPDEGVIVAIDEHNEKTPSSFGRTIIPIIVVQFQKGRGMILYNVNPNEFECGQLVQNGEILGKTGYYAESNMFLFQLNAFETDAPFGELPGERFMRKEMDFEEKPKAQYEHEVVIVDPRKIYDF